MVTQEHKIPGAQERKTVDGPCSCAPVLLCSNNRRLSKRRGQSVVEFAFGMILFGLIVYGMVQCFRWVILDLAERRVDHDKVLILTGVHPVTGRPYTTEDQLNPNFHRIRRIDAVLPATE